MVNDVEAQLFPALMSLGAEIRNPYEFQAFAVHIIRNLLGEIAGIDHILVNPVNSPQVEIFVTGLLET